VSEYPWRLVTVDIDGTLTRTHGWREIAVAFDRRGEFETTHSRFLAKEIGEDEHLTELLDLARGHTIPEVEAIVRRTPKLAGIEEGVIGLHQRGARVALLSHNPAYVVEMYRRTYGFDGGEGVEVPVDRDGRLGRVREVRADKPGALGRLLERFGVEARSTAHVGDGWSDAEVFRRVGAGIALNSRFPEVERAADRAVRSEDFRDVVGVLDELRPRA
jgi:HAD superfamily phosphoserine phosphatase-like hydrolase